MSDPTERMAIPLGAATRAAARYGSEILLERLLADVVHDCPLWNDRARAHDRRCGATFVELDHDYPPVDQPGIVPELQRR